jgi:tetratricopeptide (TPR) repeat protein
MRFIAYSLALVFVFAGIAVRPAGAQSLNELIALCTQGKTAADKIAACSRAIDSGELNSRNLPVVYSNRGLAYGNKGEYDRAIADFDQAIRLEPGSAPPFYNRAMAYLKKRQHDRAIADFDQAIRLNPKHDAALNQRGLAYSEKRQHDRAIADFDQAIQLNPKSVSVYVNRGTAYMEKHTYDRAVADFDQAIQLGVKSADVYTVRGFVYNQTGKYDQALADFEAAIRLNPKFAPAYRERAFSHESKGDRDKALADYRTSLSLDPRNKKAAEGLARVQQGAAPAPAAVSPVAAAAPAPSAAPAAPRLSSTSPAAGPGAATSLYEVEQAFDFNVLDKVMFDAKRAQLVLIGHRDPRFGDKPIPYLQHLAVYLRHPRPEMTLNWTADSAQRVDAFFRRMDSPAEATKLADQIAQVFDSSDRITPAARWFLPMLGAKPKNPNAADPWAGMDRYDVIASILGGAGKSDAERVSIAFGHLYRAIQRSDSGRMQDALFETLAAMQLVEKMGQIKQMTSRGEISSERGVYLISRAVCERLDAIFEFAGSPTTAEYEAQVRRGVKASTALQPAFKKFDQYLLPYLKRVVAQQEQQAGEAVIPLEGIKYMIGVAPEVVPEFREVDARTQLARIMLEADYLGKKLINLPASEGIPGYMNEFAWNRAHPRPGARPNGNHHLWISIDKIDARRAPDNSAIDLASVQMRFNIRAKGRDGKDQPAVPGGYEDLLTSLYPEFAMRFPVLHELEEAAKLGAVAAWIRSQDPALVLPETGLYAYKAPSRLPGVIFLTMAVVQSKNAPNSVFSAMGGVTMAPFGRGNANVRIVEVIYEDVRVVDLRTLPLVQPSSTDTLNALRAAGGLPAGVTPPQPIVQVGKNVIRGQLSTVVRLNVGEVQRNSAVVTSTGSASDDRLVVWSRNELDAQIAKCRELLQSTTDRRQRANLHVYLAELLYERGDAKAALEELRRGLAVDPQSPVVLLFYARVLLHDGDAVGAKQALETYVSLQPENAAAGRVLERLRSGSEERASGAVPQAPPSAKPLPRMNAALHQLCLLQQDSGPYGRTFDAQNPGASCPSVAVPEPSSTPAAVLQNPRFQALLQAEQTLSTAIQQDEARLAQLNDSKARAAPADKTKIEQEEKTVAARVTKQKTTRAGIEAERVDILVVFDERGDLPEDEPKEQQNETGEKPQ